MAGMDSTGPARSTDPAVPAQVNAHMTALHVRRSGHLEIGPFVGSLDVHTRSLARNYATPRVAARPSATDVAALVEVFEQHDRTPRLEYVVGAAPEAEPVLLAAGFAIDQRLAMLACRPDSAIDRPAPEGIVVGMVETSDDLIDVATVQHEAYGESEPAGPADVARLRDLLERGGLVALARDVRTGQACGAGLVTEPIAAVAEVAAVATVAEYRRRGVAGAVASLLTRAAHGRGAAVTFLDVEGANEEAVYRGVGYARAGERVWATKR
jgi:ribosomal protein S18 acetylase RimI-like enzyme